MIPTQEQIDAEIVKLRQMMPTVRETSLFGDNNHEAIEAQIRVLEEDMTDNDVYAEWGTEDPEENHYIIHSALSASQWLAGDGETDTLAEEWESLVEKGK